MPETFETNSPGETAELGAFIGRALFGGAAIALVGPLGAGKTQLVKGIAVGNGTSDGRKITSPTFMLIHEYPGRVTLFHVDAYRLSGPADLLLLGFEELIGPGSAVVVEWADRVRNVMPDDVLWIEVSSTGGDQRRFTLSARGDSSRRLVEAVRVVHR